MKTTSINFTAQAVGRFWDEYCGTRPVPFPHVHSNSWESLELSRIVRRDELFSISAKPLPPRSEIWTAHLAFYLMDVYQKTMYTSMFMQEADGKKIEENLNSWFLEFIKLCGFKSKWEILEELLKKIKIKLPPAPEPEPEWFKEPLNVSEKIILASLFMTNPGHEFLQNTGKEILTENVR